MKTSNRAAMVSGSVRPLPVALQYQLGNRLNAFKEH